MFYQSWVRTLRPKVLAASQYLKAAAADLENQAAEQERASSGEGGSSGSGTSAALAAGASAAWVVAPTTAGGAPGFASAAEAQSELDKILAQPDSPQRAEQIRQWADRLGPNQTAFAHANALAVGNTNGMPLAMRDIANRKLAVDYMNELSSKKVAGRLSEDENRTLEMLQKVVGDNADSDSDLRFGSAQVLVFNKDGDGRMAISLGAPDTSSNVSVMVPGISNELSDMMRMINDAKALKDGSPDTAVVVWLGYDTPPAFNDVSRGADIPNIGSESRAIEGAAELRLFVNGGLDLGADQRVTLIGHSYGTIVAMRAAADGGLPLVDNIVVMGSPGSEAFNSLEDLHLGEGQEFYTMCADGDPVGGGFSGTAGLVGIEEIGVVAGEVGGGVAGGVGVSMTHGFRRPQDFGFGGTRLETDQWGTASVDATGHSQYYGKYNENNQQVTTGALANLRAVTTGAGVQERSIQLADGGSAVRGAVGEVVEKAGDAAEYVGDRAEDVKDAAGDGVDGVSDFFRRF